MTIEERAELHQRIVVDWNFILPRAQHRLGAVALSRGKCFPVSYTHLTLPTTPYV